MFLEDGEPSLESEFVGTQAAGFGLALQHRGARSAIAGLSHQERRGTAAPAAEAVKHAVRSRIPRTTMWRNVDRY
jgi:hypothetical protein